jgi:hypothetical protein
VKNKKRKQDGEAVPDSPDSDVSNAPSDSALVPSVVIPALAALVMRQARVSLIEGRMIAGIDKRPGNPIGLTAEDRRAMALVSRECLLQGLPDYGSEIHDLLAVCSRPLGEWFPLQSVNDTGLSETRLINEEYGAPTVEAEELARGFSTLTAGVEEQLFAKFREALDKHPKSSANSYYTALREFVVRHPLATSDEINEFAHGFLPSTLWTLLQQQFYERVPASWAISGEVPVCSTCGNAMRQRVTGLVCRTKACAASAAPESRANRAVEDLLRVTRGIQQYWVEPGFDELRLYDALKARGIEAELYPHMDRVDIAVGDIGIDMKCYSSPELLGNRIRRDKGGLAFYARKWLVVPDWLTQVVPHYLDRLRSALEDAAGGVRCISAGKALGEITHA